MNNQPIQSIADIGPIVTESGTNNEAIQVKYQCDNQTFEDELLPSYDEKQRVTKLAYILEILLQESEQ